MVYVSEVNTEADKVQFSVVPFEISIHFRRGYRASELFHFEIQVVEYMV